MLYRTIFMRAAERGFLGLVAILQNEVDTQRIECALRKAPSDGHTEEANELPRNSHLTSIGCGLGEAAVKGEVGTVNHCAGAVMQQVSAVHWRQRMGLTTVKSCNYRPARNRGWGEEIVASMNTVKEYA